jgi:outer membrane protein assembly factor BamB
MNRRRYLRLAGAGPLALGGCLNPTGRRPPVGQVSCGETTVGPRDDGAAPTDTGAWRTVHGDGHNTGDRTTTVGPVDCPETQWHRLPTHPKGDEISVLFDHPPTVADGLVLVPSGGILYAFDAATGDVRWSGEAHPPAYPPVVVDGTAYVGSATGVHALSLSDGGERWQTETPSRVRAALKADYDRLYATTEAHEIVAMGFDGSVAWQRTVPAASRTDEDDGSTTFGPPAVGDDHLVVGGFDGTVVALHPATGETAWTRTFDESLSRAQVIGDDVVYVAGDTFLRALDLGTGRTVWTAFEDDVVAGSVAYVADDDALYVQAGAFWEDLHLVELDATDGTERWRTAVGLTEASPVVGRDRVYLGAGSDLTAIDRDSHEVVWRMEPESDIHGHPVVLDGVVYVCGVDEGLFAVT